ncbi:hypothetical protein MF133_07815 [Aeromonas caviae]|uniref:hypothetical protein n=1 Tax=Aeromonas caviae TaxID=648 RepID=UPI001EF11FF7|nr:hypothetical protein [Aeromonas caviae]ULH04296.1 hypothetical protein MF133_07815 [Aeromonas caviae]
MSGERHAGCDQCRDHGSTQRGALEDHFFPFVIAPDFMDLAFLSGSRVGTRRSVLALQSTPRRAKKWFSVVPLCLMPWRIGRGYLHRYSRYFLAVDPWRSDITKSTFAVRNINVKFPASFKNMTECK